VPPFLALVKNQQRRHFTGMSDYIDGQGFRANVGIVLMRASGDVLLGGRADGRGWQFPQGGMRRGESPEEALYRELHEEVGLESKDVDVLAATGDWLRYRLPPQYVRRRSRPRCIGQKQRWFLLRFLGEDHQLRFDATGEPEFDSWRWVDYWTPVREVVYFKRGVYAQALEQLGSAAFPAGPPPRPDWWLEFAANLGDSASNVADRGRKRASADNGDRAAGNGKTEGG
jgi:putative (di)nucleoside polyphosphate hydrolase